MRLMKKRKVIKRKKQEQERKQIKTRNYLKEIAKSVSNIADILKDQYGSKEKESII